MQSAYSVRLDLLTIAVDQLLDELYTQLHRTTDGGPHTARLADGSRRTEQAGAS